MINNSVQFNESIKKYELFENLNSLLLKFAPKKCVDLEHKEILYDCSDKATILLKSYKISINVTKYMEFFNIEFNGIDMHLDETNQSDNSIICDEQAL